jgi:hypothetical protein
VYGASTRAAIDPAKQRSRWVDVGHRRLKLAQTVIN